MLTQLLQTQYFDTTIAQWLAAATVTLVVTFVLRSITRVVHTRLADSAPQTDSLVDDVVLDMARRTFFVFQLAMGVAASSWFLNVPQHWDERIRMGVMLLAILQAGVWGSGIVNYVIVALLDRRGSPNDAAHRTGRAMLRFLGLAIVWSSVLLLSLDNLGVSVTTLIAGLGVTGIAVALATQQIFGDLFASVSILLDKPFLVGDFINLENFYGTVERIGIRSTRLRSLSGECLIFANSDLSKSRVRNFADLKERRIVWNFGLRHDTPVEKAEQVGAIVQAIIRKIPKARFDRAHWSGFSETALLFEVVYYVLHPDYPVYMDVQQAINGQLLRALHAQGLSFAQGTPIRWVPDETFAAAPTTKR